MLINEGNKERLTKIISQYAKSIHKYLEDYQYEYNFITQKYQYYKMENENQGLLQYVYSFNSEVIRNWFSVYFNLKLVDRKDELDFFNKIDFEIKDILNLHLSLPGFILILYFDELFEIESSEKIDIQTDIQYNGKLLDEILNKVIYFLNNKSVEIEFYYLISGVKIKGNEFIFDVNYNQRLALLDIDQNNSLKKLFARNQIQTNTMSFGFGFEAVLNGKIEIKIDSIDNVKPLDTGIFPPHILNESLYLLGIEKSQISFVSIPSKYCFNKAILNPRINGTYFSFGYFLPIQNYNYTPFKDSKTLELNDSIIQFIKMYPALRMKIPFDSFEAMVIKRFVRTIASRDGLDIILESAILFESLLTKNRGELTMQLKLKLPWFLANTLEERLLLSKIVPLLYDIRSFIVHDGGSGKNKSLIKLQGIGNASYFSKTLARLCVLKMLIVRNNTLEFVPRKEIVIKLDQMILGHDIDINSSIYYDLIYDKELDRMKEKMTELNLL